MAPARTAALMSAARREMLAARAGQAPRSEFVKRELGRLAASMGAGAVSVSPEAKLEECRARYAGKPPAINTQAMADYLAGLSAGLRERIEETF